MLWDGSSKVRRHADPDAAQVVGAGYRGGALRRRLVGLCATGGAALVVLWCVSVASANVTPSVGKVGERNPAADGASLYQAECARCHGEEGDGDQEGPSLRGLPAGEGTIPGVADLIRSGPGPMPAFSKFSDAEVDEIARYVVEAFGTVGDVARGGELYRLNCAGCHGAAGRGGALIYSDGNAPNLEHFTDADVVWAIRGGPGTMPAFNVEALPDAATASIARYVAVLREPAQPGGVAIAPPGPVTEGLIAGLLGLGAALLAAVAVTRGGRG